MKSVFVKTIVLAVLLLPVSAGADDYSYYGSNLPRHHERLHWDFGPSSSYIVPRSDGGYTEVYPGQGSITTTGPDRFGRIKINRRGFLPPSRY